MICTAHWGDHCRKGGDYATCMSCNCRGLAGRRGRHTAKSGTPLHGWLSHEVVCGGETTNVPHRGEPRVFDNIYISPSLARTCNASRSLSA